MYTHTNVLVLHESGWRLSVKSFWEQASSNKYDLPTQTCWSQEGTIARAIELPYLIPIRYINHYLSKYMTYLFLLFVICFDILELYVLRFRLAASVGLFKYKPLWQTSVVLSIFVYVNCFYSFRKTQNGCATQFHTEKVLEFRPSSDLDPTDDRYPLIFNILFICGISGTVPTYCCLLYMGPRLVYHTEVAIHTYHSYI